MTTRIKRRDAPGGVSSNPEVAALGLDLVIQQKLPPALLVLLLVGLRTSFRSLAPAP